MFHERLTHSLHCSEFIELTLTYEVPKWWEGFEEFLGNAVLNFYLTFLEDRDYVKVKQNYYFCIERNFRFW